MDFNPEMSDGLQPPSSPLKLALSRLRQKMYTKTSRPWFELQRGHYKPDHNIQTIVQLKSTLEHFNCCMVARDDLNIVWETYFDGISFDFKRFSSDLFPLDRESEGKLIQGGFFVGEDEMRRKPDFAAPPKYTPKPSNRRTPMPASAVPAPAPVFRATRPGVFRPSNAAPSGYFQHRMAAKAAEDRRAEEEYRMERSLRRESRNTKRGTYGISSFGVTGSRGSSRRGTPQKVNYTTTPAFYERSQQLARTRPQQQYGQAYYG